MTGRALTAACCLLTMLPAGRCLAQPYTRDARTLLLDHLDETFTPDGQQQTTPAAVSAAGDWKGGRPGKGGFSCPVSSARRCSSTV